MPALTGFAERRPKEAFRVSCIFYFNSPQRCRWAVADGRTVDAGRETRFGNVKALAPLYAQFSTRFLFIAEQARIVFPRRRRRHGRARDLCSYNIITSVPLILHVYAENGTRPRVDVCHWNQMFVKRPRRRRTQIMIYVTAELWVALFFSSTCHSSAAPPPIPISWHRFASFTVHISFFHLCFPSRRDANAYASIFLCWSVPWSSLKSIICTATTSLRYCITIGQNGNFLWNVITPLCTHHVT